MTRLISILISAMLATAALAGEGSGTDKDRAERAGTVDHGQIVSDCNHRANERSATGQERKDFVEWCVENGQHLVNRAWDDDRNCYSRANKRGLSGRERSDFLNACVSTPSVKQRYREYERGPDEVDHKIKANQAERYW